MASAATALTVQERVEQSVVAQQLSSQGRALVSLLGSELEVRRYQRLALQAIAKTPALQECTPDSLVLAIVEAAGMGLRHFGAGGAWLVPFRVNAGTKDHPRWESHAQMIPDYRAVVSIITRKGSEVRALEARVVKEGDAFDFGEGDSGTWVDHKPSLDPDRSQRVTTHIYTRAHLRAGGPPLYHVIDRGQAEAVRLRAKKKGFSPWDSDWDEMAKKTCAKAHAKWLPVPADVLDLFAREDALVAAEPEPPAVATAGTRTPRTRQLVARLRPEPDADPGPEPAAGADVGAQAPEAGTDTVTPDPGPQRASETGTGRALSDDEAEAVWREADQAPPAGLTSEAFVAWLAEHRIDEAYARGVAKRLFPDIPAGKRLNDVQRAVLRDELAKEA